MFEEVVPGDVVLVLWTDIGEATEQFQQVVHQLQASVGGYSKHKHRIGVWSHINIHYFGVFLSSILLLQKWKFIIPKHW